MVPQERASLRYVETLERLAEGGSVLGATEWRQRLGMCLDGEPGQLLLRQESRSLLRQQGAYFTSAGMAKRLAATVPVEAESRRVYFDPACGAGDLLLAVARRLPVGATLERTIGDWGVQLAGWDVSPGFVRMAKARLVLLASSRCRVRPSAQKISLASTFPGLVVRDFFAHSTSLDSEDVVLMNPPFSNMDAPSGCEWSSGKVNAAAVFTEKMVAEAPEGLRLVAILPEVLRSGTRYTRWRRRVASLSRDQVQRRLGQFDKRADVDVYRFSLVRAATETRSRESDVPLARTRRGGIGGRFAVHVGAVVPHRHKEEGPRVRFIHARSVPAWEDFDQTTEIRKFNGRLFAPPFVVVRRTSRPGDKKRAVASLVLGQAPVAVENHLVVFLPNDGEVSTCRELMIRLASPRTDKWLNAKLRCRHLTTRVLAELPWWTDP